MRISEEVRVTFVGGPLHGLQEIRARADVKELHEVDFPEGARVVYELRERSGEAVAFGQIVYSRAK